MKPLSVYIGLVVILLDCQFGFCQKLQEQGSEMKHEKLIQSYPLTTEETALLFSIPVIEVIEINGIQGMNEYKRFYVDIQDNLVVGQIR